MDLRKGCGTREAIVCNPSIMNIKRVKMESYY